jgi:hypothetical protein
VNTWVAVPVLAPVAVIVTEYVPAGVPLVMGVGLGTGGGGLLALPPPPQATRLRATIIPLKARTGLNLPRLPGNSFIQTMNHAESNSIASHTLFPGKLRGRTVVADRAVVETVMPTDVMEVTAGMVTGLKLQADPDGSPVHENATAPAVVVVTTWNEKTEDCPAVTLALPGPRFVT